MFNKIYGILSDPKYDEAVYKEVNNNIYFIIIIK